MPSDKNQRRHPPQSVWGLGLLKNCKRSDVLGGNYDSHIITTNAITHPIVPFFRVFDLKFQIEHHKIVAVQGFELTLQGFDALVPVVLVTIQLFLGHC